MSEDKDKKKDEERGPRVLFEETKGWLEVALETMNLNPGMLAILREQIEKGYAQGTAKQMIISTDERGLARAALLFGNSAGYCRTMNDSVGSPGSARRYLDAYESMLERMGGEECDTEQQLP